MIQPLRRAHRRAFAGLTVVLPAILLIGLRGRSSRPDERTFIADVPTTTSDVRESSNLWQSHTIRSTFYSRSDRPGEIDVVLQPADDLNAPDLLLYWAYNAPQGNVLPAEARFMGDFRSGKAFLIPIDEGRTGYLVLFSLARRSVFDSAKVEKLP